MSRSQHKYPPPTKKPAQKICYYYTHGGCKNGDSCPFLHVRNKEEAIAEQLNSLMDIMKSNGLAAPAAAQKRQAPPALPAKRINIVDEGNADPLGYSTPTKQESLEVRGERVRHSMKQMIDGHMAKNAQRAKKEKPVSVDDLVVRTRAEILAAQEEEEKKALAVSLPPVQSPQSIQSVQTIQSDQSDQSAQTIQSAQNVQTELPTQVDMTDSINDAGDEDDDDDAAYMDGAGGSVG